jgi:predicted DNA binding protein
MTKKKKDTIDKRITENRKAILEQLRKLPIIQVACQKTGIARATYYRWRNDDKDFAKEADEAIMEGIEIVNDLSESQLITAIKDQNLSAIRFWLQNRHKAYANKVEVLERGISDNQDLTDEQRKIVEKALRLASASPKKDDEQSTQQDSSGNAEQ